MNVKTLAEFGQLISLRM